MQGNGFKGKKRQLTPNSDPLSVDRMFKERGVRPVNFEDWKRLDRLEIDKGRPKEKVRDKFTDISRMMDAIARTQ